MTYNPGQFRNVVPFVTVPPKVLILAGPADGDEAQVAASLWPGLTVLGFEPYEPMRLWQMANGWPGNPESLMACALSDHAGTATMYLHADPEQQRGSSLEHPRGGGSVEVSTTTLDVIQDAYQFAPNSIMLWLDIEGHELEALRGGRAMLAVGAVSYVNVEILARKAGDGEKIHRLLTNAGLELVHVWNEQPGMVEDRFYRRREKVATR